MFPGRGYLGAATLFGRGAGRFLALAARFAARISACFCACVWGRGLLFAVILFGPGLLFAVILFGKAAAAAWADALLVRFTLAIFRAPARASAFSAREALIRLPLVVGVLFEVSTGLDDESEVLPPNESLLEVFFLAAITSFPYRISRLASYR